MKVLIEAVPSKENGLKIFLISVMRTQAFALVSPTENDGRREIFSCLPFS